MFKLTETKVRSLKYDDKKGGQSQMYSDGGGLSLVVLRSGQKLWRLAFRFQGKQSHLALGSYPVVSLAMAREKAVEAKRQLEMGIDPAQVRREKKATAKKAEGESFASVYRRWESIKLSQKREQTRYAYSAVAEKYALSALGSTALAAISKRDLVTLCQKVASRSISAARRLAVVLSSVFSFGVLSGLIDDNPALSLGRVLPVGQASHYAAITDLAGVQEILAKINQYLETAERLAPQTAAAARLLIATGMRIGAVCGLLWDDIDLESEKISISPRDGNKTTAGFDVFLGPRTASELREYAREYKASPFVFPSPRSPARPLSVDAVRAVWIRSGILNDHTSHGWRQTLKSIASEFGVPSLVTEKHLGHRVGTELEQTYNRATYEAGLRAFARWYEGALEMIARGQEPSRWEGPQFV